MARFSYEDADKVGGGSGSGGSFFKLIKDKEKARVQLLGDDMNDFPGYTTHEVYIGDKRRYINCLREIGDPVDVCPFCKARMKQVAKMWIPLYNIDADEVQVFERGKAFIRDLSDYCAHTPHVSEVVTEITRKGKEGDTSTTYGLYELRDERPERTLEEFGDEIPEIEGRYVFDKTASEMEYYLEHKCFPDDSSADVTPRRGNDRDTSRRDDRRDDRPVRRGRSSREDEF